MSSYRDQEDDEVIGYDAETQTHTYRTPGGHIYHTPRNLTDLEIEVHSENNKKAWSYLLPFFVLVFLFLYVMVAPPWKNNFGGGADVVQCDEDSVMVHQVEKGESCWNIAQNFGISVEELEEMNVGLSCENLRAGREICVPKKMEG